MYKQITLQGIMTHLCAVRGWRPRQVVVECGRQRSSYGHRKNTHGLAVVDDA